KRTKLHWRQDLFRMHAGYAALPPLMKASEANVYDAEANSALQKKRSYVRTRDGFVYWYCDEDIERVKVFDKSTISCLVNGPAALDESSYKAAEPIGRGIPSGRPWRPPLSTPQSGADMWRLNESRLKLLRTKGVTERSLEQIHGRSEDLLLRASETKGGQRREALAAAGFMMERVVYSLSRGTLDDLVRAVLVLLALAVPFAFAMERLIIGSPIIFRQIAWFCAFFILTFLVLFFTHPAFGVSAVPIVIFLGFAVVVLSSLVIVILMRRFEAELKRLQGMTGSVHTADVSRFGTVIAAMNMGISTMRRRPLRTALTAITVVLLTFTILAFASFSARLGVLKLFVRQPTPYSGALVHNLDWKELSPDLLDVLTMRWPQATVCPRVWVAPTADRKSGVLLSRGDGTRPVVLRGVLGIDSSEVVLRDDMRRMLGGHPEAFDKTVWMTGAVAQLVGVAEGDSVLVGGKLLRVGPLLEAHDVLQVQDMDNSDILPVNFEEMDDDSKKGGAAAEEGIGDNFAAAQEAVSWTTLPVDLSIVVPVHVARLLGGTLHAVSLYTESTLDAAEMAEELALMLHIPVAGTRPDGIYKHVLGPVVKASGLGSLVFPILLGGMVIFGTMLGSVSDREKEIYSYTALGLAPPHVAGLFFAEAMVYAVVGGMGGYLTSQGLMKVLWWLSQYGIVGVPEMNYSSSNAVITILLVMTTVLVSTIYPAVKASKSANPGVLRHWRLPHPEGDRLDIMFPFTVSSYDLTGVVSFLKENFDLNADTGLGTFMARDARIDVQDGGKLSVSTHLALAPFDLGVTESFTLSSVPSKIEGIEQVRIEIERRSGQPKDWYRLNKVLLAELRKQFLIWRSLTPDTMEMYRQRTLSLTAVEGERDAKELGAA
ncbi:MAG: FtsX-like permease family protein, partial [Chitinivibrionales bacterium]|nr:FtsX-like permease family protein [Chitinivibrionales bacterium]